MICPSCGKKIGDDTDQCYFCGAFVKEGAEQRVQALKKAKRSRKPEFRTRPVINWGQIILGFFCGFFGSFIVIILLITLFRRRELLLGALIGCVTSGVLSIILTIVFTLT